MELEEIRQHLDRLDHSLVLILAERMSFIPMVAKAKMDKDLERFQPEREKQIIEAKRKMAEELDVNPDMIEDIFKRIIGEAHRIQKEIIGK
ncbi:chorismate mutase [Nanoarchaeota archaeon]